MIKRTKLFYKVCTLVIVISHIFKIYAYASDEVVNQIKTILENYYIDNLPEEVLKASTMEEMLEYLGDPYTQYMSNKKYNALENSLNMKFVGIGAYIEMVNDGAKVTSVMSNSPAVESGIKEGDVIIMVDGYNLSEVSYGEAMSLINGLEGINSNLKIKRNNNIMDVTVLPRQIPYPTVVGDIIDNHIGYIRIVSFGNNTTKEFEDKIGKLNKFDVDSFIIDLRNNPGGYIQSAIEISEYFIGKNIALIVEDKINKKYKVQTYGGKNTINKPVIFLINEFSASAAEILLAAVRDYNSGLLIGENTFGKGVAQNTFILSNGTVLKTTIYRFYSPKGYEINNIGIVPNVKINKFDPLIAAEILLGNMKEQLDKGKFVKIKINNKDYIINQGLLKNKEFWEAYRIILNSASSIEVTNQIDSNNKDEKKLKIPQIKFAEMPGTSFFVGDRIEFKVSSLDYDRRVQYRAILWDEETNLYKDIWNTKDRYYENWAPKGSEFFTIGIPATKPGNYRIKIFCKRSGIANSKTALQGMNCDSYTAEIPFIVYPI